jgi:hypothetical protein
MDLSTEFFYTVEKIRITQCTILGLFATMQDRLLA